jgi:uncharacterized protein YuzE
MIPTSYDPEADAFYVRIAPKGRRWRKRARCSRG